MGKSNISFQIYHFYSVLSGKRTVLQEVNVHMLNYMRIIHLVCAQNLKN